MLRAAEGQKRVVWPVGWLGLVGFGWVWLGLVGCLIVWLGLAARLVGFGQVWLGGWVWSRLVGVGWFRLACFLVVGSGYGWFTLVGRGWLVGWLVGWLAVGWLAGCPEKAK